MKKFEVNKKTRELLIDGELAGVGWTAQMDKDIQKFGKKIVFVITKCMYIKMIEKYSLSIGDRIALQSRLRLIFDV